MRSEPHHRGSCGRVIKQPPFPMFIPLGEEGARWRERRPMEQAVGNATILKIQVNAGAHDLFATGASLN